MTITSSDRGASKLAGEIDLVEFMTGLAEKRQVFHSEADFQFAFAQQLASAHGLAVRLEVRLNAERAEYIDVVCSGENGSTLIELKYPTAKWAGKDHSAEEHAVRNHAAYDLARRYFVHDIARLERFVGRETQTNGLAIMLTNERGLWSAPRRNGTRDASFRLHDSVELVGRRVWGSGDRPDLDEELRGSYRINWHDYSTLEEPRGKFRWCAVDVKRPASHTY